MPTGLTAAEIKVTANGTDVTALLSASADGQRLRGPVTGLNLGDHRLVADAAGKKTVPFIVRVESATLNATTR